MALPDHPRSTSGQGSTPADSKKPTGNIWLVLVASIVIDLIGLATYVVPGLGEMVDVIWAPISAMIMQFIYGSPFFSCINFIEEISPGLDFLPTATIAWLYFYVVLRFLKKPRQKA
eukprot:CAMPEP_0114627530 /NCGR_PEP_ID=MMETSP0168-20121206/12347_1 /TAXON_ID=95228 ORGANISM="Vannella sp., Strain DIVA3 517/6/12" /NCGR_SAMPLE_ID=MMETSP0168 /ASSEMBLY_ACC=CAM_ASM_000044 /LENGTH=115 /DNA_ID=CAMNT_0001838873 /DNA_START=54 /DNA_END=398 /DNA_ORIENTATION=+